MKHRVSIPVLYQIHQEQSLALPSCIHTSQPGYIYKIQFPIHSIGLSKGSSGNIKTVSVLQKKSFYLIHPDLDIDMSVLRLILVCGSNNLLKSGNNRHIFQHPFDPSLNDLILIAASLLFPETQTQLASREEELGGEGNFQQ